MTDDPNGSDGSTSTAWVLQLIRQRGRRGMSASQLVAQLVSETPVSRSEARQQLRPVLHHLEHEGQIVAGRGKRYFGVESADLLTGVLRSAANRYASLELPGDEERVLIPPKGVRGAMDGDRVLVRLERSRRRARNEGLREGVVVRVLERCRRQLVGRWQGSGSGKPTVRPLDIKLGVTICPVASRIADEPEHGDLVVVSLDGPADHAGCLHGTLLERLGRVDDPGVVERTVLRLYGIPEAFPPEALAEAESIPAALTEPDLAGRWDLRERPVITIDPATAKDFDDAVNALRTSSGDGIVVEVHIADVSHFVQPGSALDRVARQRSTSVYLPGRCVPMLPSRVSDELCCLREGVDRLSYTVRFVVGPEGAVERFEVHDSIIHSRRRCTYDEVFTWLQTPRRQWPAETEPFAESLELLAEAARRLQAARRLRGCLDLDLSAPEVVLDPSGRVTTVRPARRHQAHRLIEELMVTANGCVAQLLMLSEQPALHRVHDPPGADRIEDLRRLLAELGHGLGGDSRDLPPASLQKVLEAIAGRPEERLLATLILRSMARAVYSPEPRGHYALATDAYLHFTSPIRRYPDLICHRMLRQLQASGPLQAEEQELLEGSLQQLAERCSSQEQRAEEAERTAVQWLTVLLLRNRIGEVFTGFITGVTEFGIFVQLETFLVDGLVHISELCDDFYLFDQRRHCLLGQRNRRRWRLGDQVEVRLVRVDLDAMQIRLAPVGLVPDAQATRQHPGRSHRQG